MAKPGEKIATLYCYRTAAGMWSMQGDRPGFIAYDYCAGCVDLIGQYGGYAELFQVDRYESDFTTTGRNWTDVYTVVRMYGTRPEHFPDMEERTP